MCGALLASSPTLSSDGEVQDKNNLSTSLALLSVPTTSPGSEGIDTTEPAVGVSLANSLSKTSLSLPSFSSSVCNFSYPFNREELMF